MPPVTVHRPRGQDQFAGCGRAAVRRGAFACCVLALSLAGCRNPLTRSADASRPFPFSQAPSAAAPVTDFGARSPSSLLFPTGTAARVPVTTQAPPKPTPPASPAIYYLPYRPGTSHLVVQPGPGPFSHKGTQRYAVDWSMPVGTDVLASRAGLVIAVKEDSNRGGASESMARHGNYVRILHSDGTSALYLHLRQNGALVGVGDVVQRGQHIGESGDTGWSAMPHLHFQLDRRTGRGYSSIPIRFQEVRGDGVPGFLGNYRSKNRLGR